MAIPRFYTKFKGGDKKNTWKCRVVQRGRGRRGKREGCF
jgi:hypothetical protein